MTQTVYSLPVSVEQIAAVIKQMSTAERQRLFELVPEIPLQLLGGKPRAQEAVETSIQALRSDVKQILAGTQPLSADTPFLGSLTLGQYLDLPDTERAKLWDAQGQSEWDEADEREVGPDALPAR
jgi:hypothetical protein